MLASARPSEAKIIYSQTHTLIETGQTIPLDLNHDGKADFSLQNYSDTFEGSQEGFLFVQPAGTKNGVDGDTVYERALALRPRIRVGAREHFVSVPDIFMISANASHRCFGNWNNVKNRYLGLKFVIKQKTHFGWARLNATCDPTNNQIKAVLTGYAYETIPGKPIITGQTEGMADDRMIDESDASLAAPIRQRAMLGMLALGAPALSVWRREEPADARSEPI
jgi:hypothetical protein